VIEPEDSEVSLEPRPTKPIEVKLDGCKDLDWHLELDELEF